MFGNTHSFSILPDTTKKVLLKRHPMTSELSNQDRLQQMSDSEYILAEAPQSPKAPKSKALNIKASETRKMRNSSLYGRCGPDRFRLIELYPGSENDRIECNIKTYAFGASPVYSAVSYTWGNLESCQTHDQTITVNGSGFPARTNLRSLLFDLRDQSNSRMLWIDAICINQVDVEERNTHVRNMDKIYSNSDCVVVWLAGVQDYRAKFTSSLESATTKRQLWWIFTNNLEGINQIYTHDYWSRTWIIQEVLLGRRVELQGGGACLPLSVLADFATEVWKSKTDNFIDRTYSRPLEALSPTTSLPVHLYNHRRGWSKGLLKNSFRTVLRSYKDFQCSDAKDKIFGLLSLHEEAKAQIPVDYRTSSLDLLLQVVSLSMHFDGLSPTELLSFGIFLKEQLGIRENEITLAIESLMLLKAEDDPFLDFKTPIYLRGQVEKSVRASEEWAVPRCRRTATGLANYSPLQLRLCPSTNSYGGNVEEICQAEDKNLGSIVSSNDLCIFGVEENKAVDPDVRPERRCIGLASTRVTNNHEIWQFKDTEIAFITTSDCSNFRLVGRTFLAREVEPFEWDRLSLGPGLQSHAVERTIRLNTALYLTLLKWASNNR